MMIKNRQKFYSKHIILFSALVFLLAPIPSNAENSKIHHDYSKYGKIIESYSGSDLRDILIIMDAHCNIEAQKNISSILSRFSDSPESRLVAIEGAAGTLNLDDIQSFPIETSRDRVTDYFLKQGKINGAEYYFIRRDKKESAPLFIGAEKPDEYRKNYDLYVSFSAKAVEAKETVQSLLETAQAAADSEFNLDEKHFDSLHQALHEKNIGYMQFCKYLIELAGRYKVSLDSYKSLKNLNQIFSDEKNIDTLRLETERKQAHKIICAKETRLDQVYNELKLGKIEPAGYYSILESAGKESGLDLGRYPQLSRYLKYLGATEKINHNAIFQESLCLSDTLAGKIFSQTDKARIYKLNRNLRLVSKLFSLDLSSYEYNLFLKKKIDSGSITGLAQINSVSKKNLFKGESAKNFDNLIKESLDFYSSASARNNIMVDNILADMDIEECDSACLIVGGFHAQGIKDILRAKDISYTIISPNMTDNGHMKLYKSRLSNEKTAFETSLEESFARVNAQNRSSISLNSHLAIASLLSGESLIGDAQGLNAFRAEYKTLMVVDSVLELEQSNIYSIEKLQQQVETIIRSWGDKNFPGLNNLCLYRDLSGKLVLEVSIGDTQFTFFSFDERTLSQFQPNGNVFGFDIGDLKIAVLPNSYMEHETTHDTADELMRELYKTPLTLNQIKEKFNPSDDVLNKLIDKWTRLNYITRDDESPDTPISLTDDLRAIIPFALETLKSGTTFSDKIDKSPVFLNQNLAVLGITEIAISDDIPFPVVIDFMFRLGKSISDTQKYSGTPVIFSMFGEEKIFYATLAKRGTPELGKRIELKSTFYKDKPFDESVRDAKLSEVYSKPSLMAEILNSGKSQADNVHLSFEKSSLKNLIPMNQQAQMEDEVLRKLFSFIGDPYKFDQTPRALVFDLDGTLCERDAKGFKPIPPEIITELKKFIAMGIKIAVISGQEHDIVKNRFLDLFDKSEWESITIYSNSGAAAIGYDKDANEIEYRKLTLETTIPGFNTNGFVKQLKEIASQLKVEEYTMRIEPCQISLKFEKANPEVRQKYLQEVLNLIAKSDLPLKAGLAGMYSIDIAVNDKSSAVSHFLNNICKTNPSQVMFFGDSYNGNDAPMAESAPDSPHFHVGPRIKYVTIPDNVTVLDNKGQVSTLYVLQKLSFLIDSAITKKINAPVLRNLLRSNNLYFDFLKSRSEITPPGKLRDMMYFPIWLATNEDQWEKAIPDIEKGDFDDVFIGISAGGVNLSYIAAAKPPMAIVVDLNPLITQLFMPIRNALISFAANRIEYLSILSGKPIRQFVKDGITYYTLPEVEPGEQPIVLTEDAPLDQIYELFYRAKFSEKYSQNIGDIIIDFMPEDLKEPAREFWKFQYQPLNQGFKHLHMLKTMIEADSRAGQNVTWLSDETRFKYIKQFVSEGKLLAVESSWSAQGIADLSAFLTTQNKKVSLIYLSNVHHKISGKPTKDGSNEYFNYVSNIASLPKTDNALILSDQTLTNSPFDSISRFTGTKYQDNVEYFLKNYVHLLDFKPDDSDEFLMISRSGYPDAISAIMRKSGNIDLARFYESATISERKAILEDFAHSVLNRWVSLKDNIRKSRDLSSIDNEIAMELTYIFGYGLKDMDKLISRYKNPVDFLFDLLTMSYSKGQVFLPASIADLKSILVQTLRIHNLDPDIVLIDNKILTAQSSTQNIAVGSTLDTFRAEHIQTHGRRPLFVTVDTQSADVIEAKRLIDRKLYTRGDTSGKFDFVIALGYNPKNNNHKILYDKITAETGEENLNRLASGLLRDENIVNPTPQQLKDKINDIILAEFSQRLLKTELINRFGISASAISARSYVIAPQDSVLRDFSKNNATSYRPVELPGSDDIKSISTGVFLIDILRSIGDEELPPELVVHGIKKDIALTDDEKTKRFDNVLSLFRDIYAIYANLSQTEKPTTLDFLNAVEQAKTTGVITPDKVSLLRPQSEIEPLLGADLDKAIHSDSFVRVFMFMIKPRWTVNDKNTLRELVSKQHKILRLNEIISAKLAVQKDGISIKDMQQELRKTNLSISDVASYLEVTIPPRPVSADLNNAINRQKSLDQSA